MFTFIRRHWLLLFLALGVLAAIYLALQKEPTPPLALASSTPSHAQTNVDLFAPVLVTFNAPLDPNLLQVVSTPEESWQLTPRNSSTFEFTHTLAFSPSTQYVLTFMYQDQTTSLAFITQKSQGDPRLVQTIKQQMLLDYPLADLTPYETNLYRVVYSDPLTLEITLKTTTVTTDKAISDIKSWVQNHGGDPAAHQYVVTKP